MTMCVSVVFKIWAAGLFSAFLDYCMPMNLSILWRFALYEFFWLNLHHNDVIMTTTASQIISLTIVYSTAYLGADQRKLQSSSSLAFVRGIHRSPVNSPHKLPVTRKMFPFDIVIMEFQWAAIGATFGIPKMQTCNNGNRCAIWNCFDVKLILTVWIFDINIAVRLLASRS